MHISILTLPFAVDLSERHRSGNHTGSRGLLDRYNLFGPPAILFFAPGGDEWSDLRVIGEIGAAGLAERLRRAATRQ